jgi:hypothetical protein
MKKHCKECKYFERHIGIKAKEDGLGVCWHRESDHLYHILHEFHYRCGCFEQIEFKCSCGWEALAGQAYQLKDGKFLCPKCENILYHITNKSS